MALATVIALAACQSNDRGSALSQVDGNICGTPTDPPPRTHTVGTGNLADISYPIGGAVQRFVNEGRDAHGIRLSVESTDGHASNVAEIQSGDLDFGFVSADALLGDDSEVLSLFTIHRMSAVFETIVASRNVPDYVACETVRAVFDNIDAFRRYHPALAGLDAETMVDEVFVAPLHPGALRYFDAVAIPVPDRLRTSQ